MTAGGKKANIRPHKTYSRCGTSTPLTSALLALHLHPVASSCLFAVTPLVTLIISTGPLCPSVATASTVLVAGMLSFAGYCDECLSRLCYVLVWGEGLVIVLVSLPLPLRLGS